MGFFSITKAGEVSAYHIAPRGSGRVNACCIEGCSNVRVQRRYPDHEVTVGMKCVVYIVKEREEMQIHKMCIRTAKNNKSTILASSNLHSGSEAPYTYVVGVQVLHSVRNKAKVTSQRAYMRVCQHIYTRVVVNILRILFLIIKGGHA